MGWGRLQSAVREKLGLLLLRIGDIGTEWTLLDPLQKSILQFMRILLPDDAVTAVDVRSLAELKIFWKQYEGVTSHVVLVGHGETDGIIFGVDGKCEADKVLEALDSTATFSKVFLSLCCHTGCREFAKPFSESSLCSEWIAPFNSIHGAVASQFCQTFFCQHMLNGKTAGVAFTRAAATVAGDDRFRRWCRGKLVKRRE